MTTFIVEYRVVEYSMAHALSLNPKAKKRIFSVDSADLGTTDILAVMEAARSQENTPKGFKLFSITDREAAQVVHP